MQAICLIRDQPHYRRAAFVDGLRAAGYSVAQNAQPQSARDLFVIWNRYGTSEARANAWEKDGGTVLVCENGYAGRDAGGHQLYAISAHGHNGSGWHPVGDRDRFAERGISVEAWRAPSPDGHILVCGQRGIGSRQMASPHGWHDRAAARLRKLFDHPVRIRPHPGNQPPATPLETDFVNCYAVAIWSSASGVRALLAGIPVIYDAPHWILASAATRLDAGAHEPLRDDAARLAALRRMAWAQWTVDEIQSGEPFALFRDEAEQRK